MGGDAAWAPYASTVFAAITTDGIVHVYDMNVNRNDRICSQKVVKRAKLTHLAFNTRNPILNVGDDRGGVNCLKLSPNPRGKFSTPPGEDPPDLSSEETWKAFWVERMEHLLGHFFACVGVCACVCVISSRLLRGLPRRRS